MCQHTDMGLRIEQLYLQGMPKKIGQTVRQTLMKRLNESKHNGVSNGDNNGTNEIKSDINDQNGVIQCVSCNDKKIDENLNKQNLITKYNNSYSFSDNKLLKSEQKCNHQQNNDLLAIVTQWTRIGCIKLNELSENIQSSHWYRILTKTTQPAHVAAVGIFLFVLFAIWPNILESESSRNLGRERRSGLTLVAYLGAFATHFGAQIWMTFVSGLSLYFALPRHTFGLCQQILFPKYFALNSMLSICTLIMYIKVIGGQWEFSSYIQVAALTICAVIEVAVRLYLAPPLLRLMREKHKFEVQIGSGQEIGHLDQRDLTKCPHYQKIHKSFRRIHMTVAIGNMTVLVCMFLHLNYIASRISVS